MWEISILLSNFTQSYNVLDIICRTKVVVGKFLGNRSALHLASCENEYLTSEEPCVYVVKEVGLTNTPLTCIVYIVSSTLWYRSKYRYKVDQNFLAASIQQVTFNVSF